MNDSPIDNFAQSMSNQTYNQLVSRASEYLSSAQSLERMGLKAMAERAEYSAMCILEHVFSGCDPEDTVDLV